MADIADPMQAVLRWAHIVAGILWIGHLYFFNWVNGPFAATLDKAQKQKVVPELMPRALFWFRWGAAWTWITGVLLMGLVFHSNRQMMFGADPTAAWGMGAGLMVLLAIVAPIVYEPLSKAFAKNAQVFYFVGLLAVAAYLYGLARWAGLESRASTIHVGAAFGTIMAWNVWFRIWPAQRKIIAAVKAGEAPDAALVALAGLRSRHNTFLSVPLVWAMINQHTTGFSHYVSVVPGFAMLAATALGWLFVAAMYKKAASLKGF